MTLSPTLLLVDSTSTSTANINSIEKKSRSSQSTVMGMAIGYDLFVFQRFVGSLRRSGFTGTIILGVDPQKVDSKVEEYLLAKNVTTKFIQHVNCSTPFVNNTEDLRAAQKELLTCLAPYPNLKARWGRFPLLRDWLAECEECNGPVLITDVRDTIFQRDPFGDDAPAIKGLQVFEEDPRMRTTNWLVEWPVTECKGVTFDEPMLCSGTTASSKKEDMLDYLDSMHAEMNAWSQDPKCHFEINGDDQSIHNYLFYTNKLGSKANAIPNRMGIVNTVGALARAVKEDHMAYTKERGVHHSEAQVFPYRGTKFNLTEGRWVAENFRLTDPKGFFSNLDGTRSCVVHQYDRFGYQLERWLQKYSGLLDSPSIGN
ncbi:expressed unknown protein [Seminavis robusta]|uniref:Uncharacterized protein n=1 Tax=Seminavis robusta TaxID=568900 RepID=A0A9N8EEI9_9STRA|nr:expressed unknown protein [Seminavis robusta]|eukprot:Sro976_g226950.1 n/a (371) ;mRNA; r:21925-23037